MFTAKEKMECAEREAVMRRRTYPRRILKGHLTRERAQKQIEMMDEIAADYRMLSEELPMELLIETFRTVRGDRAP